MEHNGVGTHLAHHLQEPGTDSNSNTPIKSSNNTKDHNNNDSAASSATLTPQSDSEFEAGYIAASLLMSATPDEREEIINIGRVFANSSSPARVKFTQLIEHIKDDNLLIRALGFVGAKLDQPGSNLSSPAAIMAPEPYGSSGIPKNLDPMMFSGVFSLPFGASPSVSLPSQSSLSNSLTLPTFRMSGLGSTPNLNSSGSPFTAPPLPPSAKRRKRSKSTPSILHLLPKEGDSLKPLRDVLNSQGLDAVTTRELTAISAHFGIPIRGNKDQRAHRVVTFLEEWEKTFPQDTYHFTKERLASCRDRIMATVNSTWKQKVTANPHLAYDSKEDGENELEPSDLHVPVEVGGVPVPGSDESSFRLVHSVVPPN